ncbi:unnamed protein product [Gongylonema pulchrum]|uniref:RING-type E3 ubiquitin transferase n=1 Tax=Gongylonema pulchrum TaxID=637853 RepID=A0A3P7RUB4_9BILA|nr:unnamed protein product [Gongylonema pulchrum]
MQCGHFFCWECIDLWLSGCATQKKICPMCRTEVRYNDIIPIYGTGKEDDNGKRRPAAPAHVREVGS